MPRIQFNILNQKQSPALYSDTLANRPAAGYLGRLFISTDTLDIYRDNGTSWDLISGVPAGVVTGSGASGQVSFWTGTNTESGDNGLFWDNTNKYLGIGTTTPGTNLDIHGTNNVLVQLNSTTTGNSTVSFQNQGAGKWRLGNLYNAGSNDFSLFDVVAGVNRLAIVTGGAATYTGAWTATSLAITGGTSSQFLKANGSVDSNTYLTTGSAASTYLPLSGGNLTGIVNSTTRLNLGGAVDNSSYNLNVTGASNFTGQMNMTSVLSWGNNFVGDRLIFGSTGGLGCGINWVSNRINYYAYGATGNSWDFSWSYTDASNERAFTLTRDGNAGGYISIFQQTTFGTTTSRAASSALVDIQSTTKGFLQPRMTTTQRDAISTPATGLSVYNTTTNTQDFYNGSAWTTVYLPLTGGNLTGIVNSSTRINVNGAVDNSIYALNTLGCINSNSQAFTGSAVSTNQTLDTNTVFIFTGGAGVTWTMPNPSGNNKNIYVKNNGSASLTVAAYSGTTIIDNTGTGVASITVAVGATVQLWQDGNIKTYQLQ